MKWQVFTLFVLLNIWYNCEGFTLKRYVRNLYEVDTRAYGFAGDMYNKLKDKITKTWHDILSLTDNNMSRINKGKLDKLEEYMDKLEDEAQQLG